MELGPKTITVHLTVGGFLGRGEFLPTRGGEWGFLTKIKFIRAFGTEVHINTIIVLFDCV